MDSTAGGRTSSIPLFLRTQGLGTKKVFVSSLSELYSKAQQTFRSSQVSFQVEEVVLDKGAKNIVSVELDTNEHFCSLQPNQIIETTLLTPPPLSTTSLSANAAPGATIATSTGQRVELALGHDAPIVSLAQFEYASGKSYDGWFFNGYSHPSVHRTMLNDFYRSHAYLRAMEAHPSLIKGKVVVDVGTGSGIWALTAARLGARRVIGVEAGNMARAALANAIANGLAGPWSLEPPGSPAFAHHSFGTTSSGHAQPRALSTSSAGLAVPAGSATGAPTEGVVDILHGTVEDLIEATVAFEGPDCTGRLLVGAEAREALASGQGTPLAGNVDLIVSEWMGYWLLTEAVLESVFRARDAWLKGGPPVAEPTGDAATATAPATETDDSKSYAGRVWPSHCAMYISPFEDTKFSTFWDDVYGIDMSPAARLQGRRDWDRLHPSVEIFEEGTMITPPTLCHWVDTANDSLEHIHAWRDTFRCEVPANSKRRPWHGFLGSWSVYFDGRCPRQADGRPVRRTHEELAARAQREEIVELRSVPAPSKRRDTHWYQSALLLPPSELGPGDVIEGSITWAPNKDEDRYFDATLDWSVNGGANQSRTWEKC